MKALLILGLIFWASSTFSSENDLGLLIKDFQKTRIGSVSNTDKKVNFFKMAESASSLEKVGSCQDGLLQNGGPIAVFCGASCSSNSRSVNLKTCFNTCKEHFLKKGNEVVNTLCIKDLKLKLKNFPNLHPGEIHNNAISSSFREPDEDGPY